MIQYLKFPKFFHQFAKNKKYFCFDVEFKFKIIFLIFVSEKYCFKCN